MIEFILLLFCVCVATGIAFWLGYDTARSRFDHFLRHARNQIALAEKQRLSIGSWITDNWPDAHAAYNLGWTEGYERGLRDAPDLREDFDA